MKQRLTATALLLSLSLGCWNYRSQLDRAEEHYRAGRYGAAVTNLSDLEHALGDLGRDDRARYAYVRGLSHAHLGQRADARHWLSMTREMIEGGASLPETDRTDMQRALTEADWVTPVEGVADGGAPSVPSGAEALDTAPRRTPAARPSPRE